MIWQWTLFILLFWKCPVHMFHKRTITYQQLFVLWAHVLVAVATWRTVSHGMVLPWRGRLSLTIHSPAFVLMNVCPSIRVSLRAICIHVFFSVWANQFISLVISNVFYLGLCDWAPTGYITGCEAWSCIFAWGAIAPEGVDERAAWQHLESHLQHKQRLLWYQAPVFSHVGWQERSI